jgi:hypothetical protein
MMLLRPRCLEKVIERVEGLPQSVVVKIQLEEPFSRW